jgi:hypothetical protein
MEAGWEQIFMFNPIRKTLYAFVYVADSQSYAVEGNLRMLADFSSALTGQNVLEAAGLVTSNLIRQSAGTLGLKVKD